MFRNNVCVAFTQHILPHDEIEISISNSCLDDNVYACIHCIHVLAHLQPILVLIRITVRIVFIIGMEYYIYFMSTYSISHSLRRMLGKEAGLQQWLRRSTTTTRSTSTTK